jgi:hypothetical protein
LGGIRGLRYADMMLIAHQLFLGNRVARGGLRGRHAEGIVIRSEDLHKAGSLELRGVETTAMFDMLSKWKQE